MNEKDIMNDYLSMIKGSLNGYSAIITETDNPQLRQTFQEMRNTDEQRQYKIYQTAKQKGYYQPAQPATAHDITLIKNQLSQG